MLFFCNRMLFSINWYPLYRSMLYGSSSLSQ
jgi:hypothetical protein